MINAEKYRNQILETLDCDCEDFGVTEENEIIMCQANRNCCICQFCEKHFCDHIAKDRWLLSEYKEPVKLSRLEYGILKFLLNDTGYRYIARNKYRHEGGVYNLYIFKDEPFEDSGVWCSGRDSGNEFYVFNNLFAFVKWEDSKPTSIKDVLDNCEVIDDESK